MGWDRKWTVLIPPYPQIIIIIASGKPELILGLRPDGILFAWVTLFSLGVHLSTDTKGVNSECTPLLKDGLQALFVGHFTPKYIILIFKYFLVFQSSKLPCINYSILIEIRKESFCLSFLSQRKQTPCKRWSIELNCLRFSPQKYNNNVQMLITLSEL